MNQAAERTRASAGGLVTIPQLARMLGVSRITVYQRVRRGQIPAVKVGRTYVITERTVNEVLGRTVSAARRKLLDRAVHRVVREYGPVLKKLAHT